MGFAVFGLEWFRELGFGFQGLGRQVHRSHVGPGSKVQMTWCIPPLFPCAWSKKAECSVKDLGFRV